MPFPVQGLIDTEKQAIKFVDEGFGTEWLEFWGKSLITIMGLSFLLCEGKGEADGSSDFSDPIKLSPSENIRYCKGNNRS